VWPVNSPVRISTSVASPRFNWCDKGFFVSSGSTSISLAVTRVGYHAACGSRDAAEREFHAVQIQNQENNYMFANVELAVANVAGAL